MGTGTLQIDLQAVAANWRMLDAMTACETAAVVKADGYGLGAGRVAKALAEAGARRFFVAVAEEGAAVRAALGPGPEINVFSGHMEGDARLLRDADLVPMLKQRRATGAPPGRPARRALWRAARQRHEPVGDGARRLGRAARRGGGRRPDAPDEPPGLRR